MVAFDELGHSVQHGMIPIVVLAWLYYVSQSCMCCLADRCRAVRMLVRMPTCLLHSMCQLCVEAQIVTMAGIGVMLQVHCHTAGRTLAITAKP